MRSQPGVVCGQCQVASPGPGIGDAGGHPDKAPALPQPPVASLQGDTGVRRWAVGPGLKSCSSRDTPTWMVTGMGRLVKA